MLTPQEALQQARALTQTGQRQAARRLLLEACEDHPDNVFLSTNSAIHLFNDRWLDDETLLLLEPSFQTASADADLHYIAACIHFHQARDGSAQKAIDVIAQALMIDPRHLLSHILLVKLYLKMERYWEAELACRTMESLLGAENSGNNTIPRLRAATAHNVGRQIDDNARFVTDNEVFTLSLEIGTFDGVEAFVEHINGQIVEIGALRRLRSFGEGAEKVLDVGCNTGDHAAFVLRFLKPSVYCGIDRNPAHAVMTRNNIFLNKTAGLPMETSVHTVCVTGENKTNETTGDGIASRRLDHIATGSWDLIRIATGLNSQDVVQGATEVLSHPGTKVYLRAVNRDDDNTLNRLEEMGFVQQDTIVGHWEKHHFLVKPPA